MDNLIFSSLNQFAGQPALDQLADSIAEDWVFTGVLQLVFFWYFWFREPVQPGRREMLLRGIAGICLAILVARVLSHLLPYRPRPLLSPLMHPVSLPHDVAFDQMSSFPSDTTAYFVAFGTALWFVSRRLGVALVLYAMTVMTLPRIYLGLHYPSDCAAGWLIGLVVPSLTMWLIPDAATTRLMLWSRTRPGIFYAALFAVSAEMSNAFRDVRATLHGLAWLVGSPRGKAETVIAIAVVAVLVGSALNLRKRNSLRRP